MKKKILLIDDDTDTQKIYSEKLGSEGFEVVGKMTGNEGLAYAKTTKPDLVLLDIMLPGSLNGFDVLESFKKDDELKKIPVLILTNIGGQEKPALEIGADDYIVKANTDLNQIVEKVKSFTK
jgi:two-component system phosphate regulon response regulator PhoB